MNTFEDLEKKVLSTLGELKTMLQTNVPSFSNFVNINDEVQLIEHEISKIEKQELTLAVIATMKAGKSTFLNTIIGEKFLPYHDRPMTVIPTEVVLTNDAPNIRLVISSQLKRYIDKIISEIRQKKIGEIEMILSRSGYSNLIDYLNAIFNKEFIDFSTFENESSVSILYRLKLLNHIVRIGIVTGGSIEDLPDVPRIEAPFVPFENIPLSNHIGSLVLIDTPGENESLLTFEEIDNLISSNYYDSKEKITQKIDKMQESLTRILIRQMQKASVCIGLVDYTGQGNKASVDIISKLAVNIGQRGPEQIFILLNKYDQRKDLEDSSGINEFKKDFESRFRGSGFNPDTQIFPISSLFASEYRNFKTALLRLGDEKILESDAYKQLISTVFNNQRRLMEPFLLRPSLNTALEYGEMLWDTSLFDDFLKNVLKKLIENAIPITLKSGLEVSKKILLSLNINSNIVLKALEEDRGSLLQKIADLEADLIKLESQRKKIDNINRKIERLRDSLKSYIGSFFSTAVTTPTELITTFGNKDYIETDEEGFSKFFHDSFDIDQDDARGVASKLSKIAQSELERIANAVADYIKTQFDNSTEEIFEVLEEETKPIVAEIERKLKSKFDLEDFLTPPKAKIKGATVDTDVSFSVHVEYRKWWTHTSKHVSISKRGIMDEYRSKVISLRKQFDAELENMLKNKLEESVNDYFNEIDSYIEEYRGFFKEASSANQLDITSKKKLEDQIQKMLPISSKLVTEINDELALVARMMN